jgi:hypothetical protein
LALEHKKTFGTGVNIVHSEADPEARAEMIDDLSAGFKA